MRPTVKAAGVGVFGFGLVLAIIGILLFVAPSRIGGIDVAMPWLAAVTAYMWGALRPGIAQSIAAFALGLAQDYISGGPLGPFALGFVVIYGVAALQRDALAGQTAAAAWLGFALAVIAGAIAAWIVGWVGLGRPPGFMALASQAVLTIVVGALAARLLGGFGSVGVANAERA